MFGWLFGTKKKRRGLGLKPSLPHAATVQEMLAGMRARSNPKPKSGSALSTKFVALPPVKKPTEMIERIKQEKITSSPTMIAGPMGVTGMVHNPMGVTTMPQREGMVPMATHIRTIEDLKEMIEREKKKNEVAAEQAKKNESAKADSSNSVLVDAAIALAPFAIRKIANMLPDPPLEYDNHLTFSFPKEEHEDNEVKADHNWYDEKDEDSEDDIDELDLFEDEEDDE